MYHLKHTAASVTTTIVTLVFPGFPIMFSPYFWIVTSLHHPQDLQRTAREWLPWSSLVYQRMKLKSRKCYLVVGDVCMWSLNHEMSQVHAILAGSVLRGNSSSALLATLFIATIKSPDTNDKNQFGSLNNHFWTSSPLQWIEIKKQYCPWLDAYWFL